MSALTDALTSLRTERRGPQCSVGALLDTLKTTDPDAHRLLTEHIENASVPAPSIALALNEAGFRINRDAIVRHRRRAKGTGCRCDS